MEREDNARKSIDRQPNDEDERRSNDEGDREASSGEWTLDEIPIRADSGTTISIETAREMQIRQDELNLLGERVFLISLGREEDEED